MKIALLALCSILSVAGLVLAEDAPSTQPAKPINTICPIEHGKVDPGITVEYKGKVIAFCCDGCPEQFQKDPEKYMKELK